MHLVVFTNLFPDTNHPRHGIFVQERLSHLVATGAVDATVIALRPFSWSERSPGGPVAEVRVLYQRVPTLPKLSNWLDPVLWALAAKRKVEEAIRSRRSESIIDAHFLYPDGVAATLLGMMLDVPVVLSARGSDVNVKCQNYVMRNWIRWAASRSDGLISVSESLHRRLQELGIRSRNMLAIPNGVDLKKFRPLDRVASRRQLRVNGLVLASIGHLSKAKGHHKVIRSLTLIDDSTLLIAGTGPEEDRLKALASKVGVEDRVRFLGHVNHGDLATVYSAADVTVLASDMEGMPNVVLESLACGTRVIASDVGGIPEIIKSAVAGAVLSDCSPEGIARGIAAFRDDSVGPEVVRRYAHRFDWSGRVNDQLDLYGRVLAEYK